MELEGILVVNKKDGVTSHDMVDLVRKKFSIKKVGHSGTLDPFATGVLVLMLGRKATRLSMELSDHDKEYYFTMKFGQRTDTADRTGNIIEEHEPGISWKDLEGIVPEFTGEIEQIPPMMSAKKVNGKKLYKLARKGIEIERKPGKVNIKELELLEIELPFASFRTVCSKGTYIRQLADDMGKELGCGAHLTELVRTRSGPFTIEEAVHTDDLVDMGYDDINENITRIHRYRQRT